MAEQDTTTKTDNRPADSVMQPYRDRLAVLKEKKAELLKQLTPARVYHDKHVNDPQYIQSRKTIKELNSKIAPLDQEMAGLAKMLGGKSMKLEPAK